MKLALISAVVTTAAAAPSVTFSTVKGFNACDTRCTGAGVTYPFKYLGSFASDADCQAACLSSGNCSIWIHSSGSSHCFSRLDSDWVGSPDADITSACVPTIANCGNVKPVPPPPTPPPPPTTPVPFNPTNESNMNGEYVLSLTPEGQDAKTKFPTNFKDYPGGVEYFDVYSPNITSLYSQVFWTGLPPVDLPDDIVQRYAGRGMAVVGYEVDQVRRGAGPNGEDVSLPINVAYNHHFESNMAGAHADIELVKFTGPNDPRIAEAEKGMGHRIPNHKEHWIVRDKHPEFSIPSSQSFGGANGGEYRKSFHGFAPGFAQVIYSPQKFQMTPMQIDTWHREKMNLTGSKFVQGPVPRNSWSPPTGSPDSLYSGLLECPVTTRLWKEVESNYEVLMAEQCDSSALIASATECFAAAPTKVGAAGNIYVNKIVNDSTYPTGCSATADATNPMQYNVFFNTVTKGAQCGASQTVLAGATSSLVNVSVAIDTAADEVTITMVGPNGVWYGAGFDAQAMKDAPWAVIVDGSGKVSEYKLSDQGTNNKLLTPSVTTKSTTVVGSSRTTVVTRALKGASADYYTFDPKNVAVLPFINAYGSSPTLSFHKAKVPTSISILASGINASGACICTQDPPPFGSGKGKFVYHPNMTQPGEKGQGTISFGNRCAAPPYGDLLAEKNPTCDVRAYVGGQTACHHMFSLLDADQDIPWVDQPLVYQQKFRFWVQPYNESYHTNLKRSTWGIGSPVEYDVPKCGPNIQGCSKDPESGRWIHTIRGTYGASGNIAAGHFHCHAPTCKVMSMYTCPPNLKAGECNETTGTLICTERPIYGGTGKIDQQRYDEPGYILQPPCLFGSSEFGLQAPVEATSMMFTYKESYADYGHHGEMAWQQMYIF